MGRDGKLSANWVINDLLGALNKAGKGIEELPVSPDTARRRDRL